MQWPLEAFARGGFRDLVVNTAWLGEQIRGALRRAPRAPGRPRRLALFARRADFGGALETAGGIARALPLLDDVFWLVAGDVFVPDFVFTHAGDRALRGERPAGAPVAGAQSAAQPQGRFRLRRATASRLEQDSRRRKHTFSTIALYRRRLFAPPCAIPPGNPQGTKAASRATAARRDGSGQVSAELYTGRGPTSARRSGWRS